MDAVKNFFECFNYHWIIIVATGIYIHLRQICIIGLCFDDDLNLPFDPSYASVLFIFSVLCLLAEYKLWPRSLKEPPVQLMIVYEMMVSSLVTNLSMKAIWVPLVNAIWCMTQESSRWLEWLNDALGLDRYSFLNALAAYMCDEMAAFHTAFCLSLLSFVWMLDATESLDGILDIWTK
ncbi:uncharacterized protein LOC122507902 [Leptopilina heterotoma]|uniref:uncharacterized protein LOC122507902 n=1 Tax=Leptopilina heterotoma TaxID=63436 RepID=UPI001CA8A567|nr:uncharacterized protein LOC122507902 [Leptopilina heterotoma]